MSDHQLPNTWLATNLGSVIDYGKTSKAEPDEIDDAAWILELEDIEKDTSRILTRLSFKERQSKSTKNRFVAGDVLYGKLRPYLNKIVIADQAGYCTTEIIPLRAGPHLDKRFLFYWLKHPAFLSYVEAESHGMSMPRLGTDTGKAAPFVLAPLNEQKRIADKLDAVLARVDACRDRLERIPVILKRFRQAVLAAATSGELTEDWRGLGKGNDDSSYIGQGWVPTTIGAIAIDLRYGTSKKCDYLANGLGVIRIPNISNYGRIDASDLKRAEFDANEIEKLALNTGDILIIRSNGSVELVGKASVVSDREKGLLFAGYLIRLRVDESMILPPYAHICLTTPEQRKNIELASKSTSGVNNINADELRALPISLAPITEQAEIVRRVDSLFAHADRLEANYRAARAQVEQLTPALLAKAFRGELVPQDPNDAPASDLLARNAPAAPAAPSTRTRKAKTPPT